jgi:MoaA/NifB/PqqE/SkfB family radical SAM enzyme
MDFPQVTSFTITNHCNLRCQMCGQWSQEGYIRNHLESLKHELSLPDWKRLVDELAAHGLQTVLLRGGETFMFPGIIELLDYIHNKGMYISIDTNGTLLKQYAEDIVRIGSIHLTISVDGPEDVHDAVRGVAGTFQRMKEGVARIAELEAAGGNKVSRSATFTISRYNYHSMGVMPDVVRSVGIPVITIVPYYYFPEAVGRKYEQELSSLGGQAFSWVGFHHEDSGVDVEEYLRQFRLYKENLGDLYNYPYMAMDEEQYRVWFADAQAQVGPPHCQNVEKYVDIQPDGSANFCVDFVDYSFGNVKDASIEQLWNGEPAERFREFRRKQPLAACYRCGAKYMSQMWSEYG